MGTKLILWFLLLTLSGRAISFVAVRNQGHEAGFNNYDRGLFIKTLQSMVVDDLEVKPSKYRRLEDDPFIWKFFIRPRDLEELLVDTSFLKQGGRQGFLKQGGRQGRLLFNKDTLLLETVKSDGPLEETGGTLEETGGLLEEAAGLLKESGGPLEETSGPLETGGLLEETGGQETIGLLEETVEGGANHWKESGQDRKGSSYDKDNLGQKKNNQEQDKNNPGQVKDNQEQDKNNQEQDKNNPGQVKDNPGQVGFGREKRSRPDPAAPAVLYLPLG